jgi:O-antigen/teichoic acid export membrane protein
MTAARADPMSRVSRMTSTAAGPDQPGLAAARTTGASVVRGGTWNLVARVLPQACVLIISVAAARFLGPHGMGRQSFIAFVALSTTMFFTGGLSVALMRFVGEELGRDRPGTALSLVRWAGRVAVVGAAVAGGGILVVALAGAEPQSAWILAGLGAAFGVLHTVPSALLIGAQRWRDATIVGLTTSTIAVPATIAVLAAGGGITGMFAVGAAVGFANFALTWVLARGAMRSMGASPQRDRSVERAAARYAAWASLGVLLTFVVFRRSEFFFLDQYSTDSEIAFYSIAFATIYGVTLVFEATGGVVIPAFATLKGAGETERIRVGYERSLRLVTMASLPIAAGVLAVGPETLRLVYGDDYSATEPVVRLLALSLPFIPIMYISSALLAGLGLIRPDLVAGAFAAVLNVALALLLIPAFDAVGAAIANTGAQVAVAVGVFGYTWRLMGAWPLDTQVVLRAAGTAAVAGGAAWTIVSALEGVPGVVLGTAAGIAGFALTGRLVRVLRDDDAQWLWAASGERALGRIVRPVCRVLAGAASSGGAHG